MSEQAMQEAERLFVALGLMVEAAAERTGVPRDEISRHLWQVMTGYVIHTGLEGEDTAIAWVRTTARDGC